MPLTKIVPAFAALIAASSASAADWAPAYLGCLFTDTVFSATDNIYPDHRNEKLLEISSTTFEMAFSGIDLSTHRAQLIGNQGAAQIGAYRGAHESVVFLERTPVGNINLTTVFPPSSDGKIRAVASRHIAEPLGGYMASQFLGSCLEHSGKPPGTNEE